MRKILLFLLFAMLPALVPAQIKTFSPRGIIITDANQVSIAGSATKIVLFSDTIRANTLVSGKVYSFRVDLALTTPIISSTTLTIEIKYGSSALSVVTSGVLVGSLTNAPVTLRGDLVSRGTNSQLLLSMITQLAGTAINLSTSNSNARGTMAVDATTDQLFTISVQMGGASLGTSTIIKDFVCRYEY